MKTAIITLSELGLAAAKKLHCQIDDSTLFVHSDVDTDAGEKFDRVIELTDRIFEDFKGLIYIMPCGVVVRAIAAKVKSKFSDPAVVVLDVAARHAVSLLSGHEGKANELALRAANILDAEPVISTTTEAAKTIIVGVGCRQDAKCEDIIDAVKNGAKDAGVKLEEIRLLASADIKSDETGLLAASKALAIPIRFISSDQIRNTRRDFQCSQFVQQKVNLPAVAEPAALLAGTRTTLILPRTIYNHVTVAVAKENCLSSGSGQAEL